MNGGMTKAQRMYDNQTPPGWGSGIESAVEEWITGDGAAFVEDAYEGDTGFGRGMPFDDWVCKNWGQIVEWFTDQYEEPEPAEVERGE